MILRLTARGGVTDPAWMELSPLNADDLT